MTDINLPALPGSDPDTLQNNEYNGFYDTTPAEFWGQNQTVREKLKDFKKCEHQFSARENDAVCDVCHMIYENFLLHENCKIEDRHLVYKGLKVDF